MFSSHFNRVDEALAHLSHLRRMDCIRRFYQSSDAYYTVLLENLGLIIRKCSPISIHSVHYLCRLRFGNSGGCHRSVGGSLRIG